jgi:hypothetical protein
VQAYPAGVDDTRELRALGVAAAAALATVFGVAWRAAEELRGLDLADLRSVVIVAVAVLIAARFVLRAAGER